MPRIIAEFKRASPSKGLIRKGADAAEFARAYAAAGAAALSVLTDETYFQGGLQDLERARATCELPVLRKDFVIDELQLLEARSAGADAILLIVAALEAEMLGNLLEAAGEIGLDALVEVHTRVELDTALERGARILGVNNRNLHSFETDVEVTRALLPYAAGRTLISESGLAAPDVIASLAADGVHAFLVGEALMRAESPGAALRELRSG